jgi:hypothetical protein
VYQSLVLCLVLLLFVFCFNVIVIVDALIMSCAKTETSTRYVGVVFYQHMFIKLILSLVQRCVFCIAAKRSINTTLIIYLLVIEICVSVLLMNVLG